MNWQNETCVMVMNASLPRGLLANMAASMGITLGKKMPEVAGIDVMDQSGNEHLGIIEFPVPVLQGSPEDIRRIREKLYQPGFQDLTVMDFSDLAQDCKIYDEFIEKWAVFLKASCGILAPPFAARRKRSISWRAVCRCSGRPMERRRAIAPGRYHRLGRDLYMEKPQES